MPAFDTTHLPSNSSLEFYLVRTQGLCDQPIAKGRLAGRCVRCEGPETLVKLARKRSQSDSFILVIKEVTDEGKVLLHIPKRLFPKAGYTSRAGKAKVQGALTPPDSSTTHKTQTLVAQNVKQIFEEEGQEVELVEDEHLDTYLESLDRIHELEEPTHTHEVTAEEEDEKQSTKSPEERRGLTDLVSLHRRLSEVAKQNKNRAVEHRRQSFDTLTERHVEHIREGSHKEYVRRVLLSVDKFRELLRGIQFYSEQQRSRLSS